MFYWEKQVDEDFDCSNVLYKAKHFAQYLFWAHLALEKLTKALWIKNNESNTPPLVHNYFVFLLKQMKSLRMNN